MVLDVLLICLHDSAQDSERGPCVESVAFSDSFLNLFHFPALSLCDCLHDLSPVDLYLFTYIDVRGWLALICLVFGLDMS